MHDNRKYFSEEVGGYGCKAFKVPAQVPDEKG